MKANRYKLSPTIVIFLALFVTGCSLVNPSGKPDASSNDSSQEPIQKIQPAGSLSLLQKDGGRQISDIVAPEISSGWQDKKQVEAQNFMVSVANPVAANAGYEVLKQGGSAVDALVAVQMVLGLVEPQSSGLGGGAFAVYYDAQKQKLTTFDGRETAPLLATPNLFLDEQGSPLTFYKAVVGGRSVGTPGTVKLMGDMHKKYGAKPWRELLKPAIDLAREGFVVSPRLANSIAKDQERLSTYPDTKNYFFNEDGEPLQAGQRKQNLAYAATLSSLALNGAESFYIGEIPKAISQKVLNVASNPGNLLEKDFISYKVKERKPVCLPYKIYDICGMGPPSSGALTVGQIMGIVSHFDLQKLGANSPVAWQIIGDASRLAFADRGLYMADTDFIDMPDGLLDQTYLANRAALIIPGTKITNIQPGEPPWTNPVGYAKDESLELPSTSHISIIDKQGNAVSVTTTIENGFGSRVMSQGFLLNNELTDFSFVPEKNGKPVANRLDPGKRPRSSMSPTIVFKNDKPYMIIGSPGGSRIIGYVVKTLITHLEWGMNIQEAINYPNIINRFGTFDLEADSQAVKLKPALEKMGYEVSIRDLNSGLQGIIISQKKLTGGADPRREGLVLGD